MSSISAQISIYPLRQRSIAKVIEGALDAIRSYDVEVTTTSMSTTLIGDEVEVFSALRAGFLAARTAGDAVMVMTVSNACSLDPAAADRTATDG